LHATRQSQALPPSSNTVRRSASRRAVGGSR
jgi:hypothetical protein